MDALILAVEEPGHFSSMKSKYALRVPALFWRQFRPKIPYACLACIPCHLLREGAVIFAPSRSQSPTRSRVSALRSWSPRSLGLKCGRSRRSDSTTRHASALRGTWLCYTFYARFLMPFANADERAIHFQRHGHEFGAGNELQYETMADAFMGAPMTLTMRECVRPNGTHRVRLNVANKHFGVAVVVAGIILTFYIVPLHKLIRRGGIANFFVYECARTNI